MNIRTPKQQFLMAFQEATVPAEGKEGLRQRGQAQFEVLAETDTGFTVGDNEVYLNTFRVAKQRGGIGREGMAFLNDLADKFNIDVVLHAAGMDDDSPSDYEIVQFYKACGYKKCGPNNEMFRSAARQEGGQEIPPPPSPSAP